MTARALLLLVSLGVTQFALSMTKAQADSLLAEGHRLYIAGDHQAALHALLAVEEGFESPSLQLSIGNAWYKLGDIPHALLHYERGLRLDPSDADLRANRDLANSQVKDRLPGEADHALARRWQELQAGSDPDQWARRALWLIAITCALIIAARMITLNALRRTAQITAACSIVLLVASVGFAAAGRSRMLARDTAIIMAPRIDARAEPIESAKPLFILHKGSKVELRDSVNGWHEVRLPNGSAGWMPANSLERI